MDRSDTRLRTCPEKRTAVNFEFSAIGYAETPYQEKFSIPRQPGLVTSDNSSICLTGKANREEILRGLEGFSHIWLVFVFHEAQKENWKPMVRPPRLGGNQKVGVFASRSPFRPNPIGLSVVKIRNIEKKDRDWRINIDGCDLLNGTPILDIKPYLPYADSLADTRSGFAAEAPGNRCEVVFSDAATSTLNTLKRPHSNLERLIREVLQQQPEPAYHKSKSAESSQETRIYGISLYNLNIRWRYKELATQSATIEVITID